MNEILMYGPIGEDFWEPESSITAKSIMSQLADMTGDVTVRISSGGGDVYAGIDIMNALKNYDGGEVTVIVESLAASAASFIAVGGADRVLMRASSELMIHRAWTWAEGNADEVAKTLKDLERQDTKLANIYAAKAGGTVEDWLAAMSDETWYTADEAVAAGLADEVIAEKSTAPEPAAKLARRRFKFANRSAAPPPTLGSRSESVPEVNQEKGDTVGILNQLAKELGKSPEDVQRALSGFFNEVVQVSSEVDVTYPEATAIAPTEKVVVEPVIGGGENGEPTAANAGALGLTFAVKTAPDGWTVTVDEATGVLTVTAPSGVEVGATAEVTVSVNGTVDVAAGFAVRSLSDDGEQTTGPAPTEAPAAPGNTADTADVVTVPRAHFDYLNRVAANFAEAQAKLEAQEHEKTVDQAIAEGRFAAANRAKALADLARDPSQYAATWGALPKGTIPVAELGNAGTAAVKTAMAAANDPRKGHTTREELMERAKARAAKKEGK